MGPVLYSAATITANGPGALFVLRYPIISLHQTEIIDYATKRRLPAIYSPTNSLSSNHPIRSRQHIRRNRETDLLGGFEIDDKIELHRLLNRQVCRSSPVKNAVYKVSTPTKHIRITRPIRHE